MDYDCIPVSILILDNNEKISFANSNFHNYVMYFSNLTELSFIKDIVKEEDKSKVRESIKKSKLLKKNQIISCNILILNDDNNFPTYKFYTLNIKTESTSTFIVFNEIYNNCTITTDSNEVIKKEVIKKKYDDEYVDDVMDFIDNAPIALQRLSATGHVLWANKIILDLLGYEKHEFVGKHITDFSCSSKEILDNNSKILSDGGTLHNLSSQWKTKTGQIKHVLINSNIHRDKSDNIKNTRCFILDDTAYQIQALRKQIETDNKINKIYSQDNFLRRVLHEIRTPINIVVQELDEDNEIECKILHQMKNLIKIIKDVEDADQFEIGKSLVLHPTKFNLITQINILFNEFKKNYSNTDNEVEKYIIYDINLVQLLVFCDKNILLRIISHLLDNAMKFTENGYVSLEIKYTDNRLYLSVKNTGEKLDDDTIYQVCQKYWETKDIDSRFGHGIGLGLNIVFNLLQCMNSTLQIYCINDVNIFSFSIDLLNIDNKDIYNIDTKEVSNSDKLSINDYSDDISEINRRNSGLYLPNWVDVQDSNESKKHVVDDNDEDHILSSINIKNTCEFNNQAPKRIHILVVEDNTICQKVLCRVLHKLDCTTSISSNGKIACDMVSKEKYDLIFMDLRMPVMDGLEASKIISNVMSIKTPIIALSADTTENIQQLCYQSGISFFVEKPVTKKQIKSIIATYVV